MKTKTSEKTIAVGMFIRTIRETAKAPSMYSCLKKAGYKSPSAKMCRAMTEALKALKVYGIHRDGTAFLYRENFDSVVLMLNIDKYIKEHEAPKARAYKKTTEPYKGMVSLFTWYSTYTF